MRYFTIMTGLRGCYMPDSVYTVKCETRRELKDYLSHEADSVDSDDSMVGLSKRNIAHIAALAWRNKRAPLPYCIPYGYKPEKIGQVPDYHYGIMVGQATRQEYLGGQEQED